VSKKEVVLLFGIYLFHAALPTFFRPKEKCCFINRLGLYADTTYFEHLQRYRNKVREEMGLPRIVDTDLEFFINNPEIVKELKWKQLNVDEWKKAERSFVTKERQLVDEVLNDPTFIPQYKKALIDFGQKNKDMSPDELRMYHSQVQEFKKFLKFLEKVEKLEREDGRARSRKNNKRDESDMEYINFRGDGGNTGQIWSILKKNKKDGDLASEVSSQVPVDPNKRNERLQTIDDRLGRFDIV